jgi:hypothetical protein
MFPTTLPNSESNLRRLALDEANVHVNMANIFRQSSTRTGDIDNAGLDGKVDAIWNLQFFSLQDVSHLEIRISYICLVLLPSTENPCLNPSICRHHDPQMTDMALANGKMEKWHTLDGDLGVLCGGGKLYRRMTKLSGS